MNKIFDTHEVAFEAKLPVEYHSIMKSVIDDMDTIKKFSRCPMDDEDACSLAYGKTIWQKFMFPLLKDISDELGLHHTDLAQDIYNWFSHCRD